MEFPADLQYTPHDEWLRVEGDEGTIGVTDYAQDLLGAILSVELPALGTHFDCGEAVGVVRSATAASAFYAPVRGVVIARNDALQGAPETVNRSPYGTGWMLRVSVSDLRELDALMTAAEYRADLPV